MRYCRFLLVLLFTFSALLPAAFAQRGARVSPQNLAELSRQSAVIVRGHVLSAVVERHPQFTNLNTIVVTMKVDAALKGAPGRTYTFRQFIWDPRDARDGRGGRGSGQ